MFQTPALVKAVASVERRVVSAVAIYPTIELGVMYGAISPRIDAIKVLDILNGLGLNPSTLMPPSWVVCLDWKMLVAKIIAASRTPPVAA